MIFLTHRRTASTLLAAAALVACSTRTQMPAPVPAATAPLPTPLAAAALTIGSAAPEFTLRGATRYGLLETPVRLSDYRGQTVVIAFFYRARSKG